MQKSTPVESILFMIFIHIHQMKMFISSELPHCHIAAVYHKCGCLCSMLSKKCLCILCWHPNHMTALHQSSLTGRIKDHHQAGIKPTTGKTRSNSLSNMGHVKILKITVIIGMWETVRMYLYGVFQRKQAKLLKGNNGQLSRKTFQTLGHSDLTSK